MYLLVLLTSILFSQLGLNVGSFGNSLQWSTQQPGFNFRERAEEILRRSASVLLQSDQPAVVEVVEPRSSPPPVEPSTAEPSTAEPVDVNRGDAWSSVVMTTSSEILPIILPTFEGLPISNTWHTTAGVSNDPIIMDQVNMQRWFVLMDIAASPSLLDHNGSMAVVGAANIPGEKWQEYFQCGRRDSTCELRVAALDNQPGFGGTIVPVWKGASPEEWDRSHRKFVADYGQLLISQASSLPQEMYVVTGAHLRSYSAEQGGIPLASSGFLEVYNVAEQTRNLKLAHNYSATTTTAVPETLPCSPSECESILDAIPGRQELLQEELQVRSACETRGGITCQSSAHDAAYPVYLVVKVKVDRVQGSQRMVFISPGMVFAGAPQSTASIVGGIDVYADKELSKRLHRFEE